MPRRWEPGDVAHRPQGSMDIELYHNGEPSGAALSGPIGP
jgi:hypothetical protein